MGSSPPCHGASPWRLYVRSGGIALASLAVAGALGACGSSGTTAPKFAGPYGEAFKDAYDNEKDPISKTALSDGRITRAEYDDAYRRYESCMEDRGFDVEVSEDGYGFYQASGLATDGAESANDACAAIYANVSYLYVAASTNPNNEDEGELLVRCLKTQKLVGASYTKKQLDADYQAGQFPFDEDDPKAEDCFGNPQVVLGGT